MECEECQSRPATLHFTEIVNGEKTEVYVCEQCAEEQGYLEDPKDGYSLHHLLSGLLGTTFEHSHMSAADEEAESLECSQCGLTLSQFKRIGKFGCPTCYHTFSDHLNSIFRRVHSGNTAHYGKIPKRIGGTIRLKKEVDEYKEKLQELIKDEAFEEAAEVRDKIKALEAKARGDHT